MDDGRDFRTHTEIYSSRGAYRPGTCSMVGIMARKRVPKLCYHRGAGRWYVTLDGTEEYLGKRCKPTQAAPPDVQQEYDRIVAAWLSARALPPERLPNSPTIIEVWSAYLAVVKEKYGEGERNNMIGAGKLLAQTFGEEPIASFTAGKLRQLQELMQGLGWAPRHVNKQVSRIRRLFRWAVVDGLVPQEVWLGLKALPGVKEGKRYRRERKVVEVSDEVIEQTLPHLKPLLQAMVRAHRLIGCRAQEITVARTCDFDLEADPDQSEQRCWLYTPSESKTEEQYWVGPRAQEILRPLLQPADPTAWLFPTHRKRGPGHFTTGGYWRAVERACLKGGVPHWSPLQVRHRAAEEARQRHPKGIEAAQARLRHANAAISEIYAHDLSSLGRDVARQLG